MKSDSQRAVIQRARTQRSIQRSKMNKSGVVVLVFAVALGCSRGKTALEPTCCSSEEAEPDSESAEMGDETPADCTRFTSPAEASAQFEEGKRLVQSCDEACLKSAEGGKDRARGLELLKEAAEQGHLEAQSLYGRTLFGDLMTTGSEAELRAEYVEALYFVALAAKRGDAVAIDTLPALKILTVTAAGDLSEELAEPLSSLDGEWVKLAVTRAQSDARCFAK